MKIGFDIDGVLCDLINSYINKLKENSMIDENISEKDIYTDLKIQFNFSAEQEKQILNYDLYYNLHPNMEIINDIRSFIDHGYEILYITARYNDDEIKQATIDWLRKYDIFDRSQGCIHERSDFKYIHAKENNLDFFIDDYHKVIKSMKGIIPYPFLLKGTVNKNISDLKRYEWGEIKNTIKDLSFII